MNGKNLPRMVGGFKEKPKEVPVLEFVCPRCDGSRFAKWMEGWDASFIPLCSFCKVYMKVFKNQAERPNGFKFFTEKNYSPMWPLSHIEYRHVREHLRSRGTEVMLVWEKQNPAYIGYQVNNHNRNGYPVAILQNHGFHAANPLNNAFILDAGNAADVYHNA